MHCPKCGQQQISEEVRFCSRCGFLLEGVAHLVASGGMVSVPPRPMMAAPPAVMPQESATKQRATQRGTKMVFWSVVLFPFFLAFSIGADSPGPLVVPFTLFFLGIMQIIYARLFGEHMLPSRRERRERRKQAEVAPPYQPPNSLPPMQSTPVAPPSFRQRADTAEFISPPGSVTENTTRLLDDQ
ncbi:MAG TPA: zinc ribbon domain-containing protein [Pyrinomonadaceae bacterium]|nr:zinc ribbon domain-containing protein [Pyrinomonadaceae bacterium]